MPFKLQLIMIYIGFLSWIFNMKQIIKIITYNLVIVIEKDSNLRIN